MLEEIKEKYSLFVDTLKRRAYNKMDDVYGESWRSELNDVLSDDVKRGD